MHDPNPLPSPSSCEQIRVRSHGRIHFGLMEISESQPNRFGGIGLMIEHPIAVVHATLGLPSSTQCDIQADDDWRPRIMAVVNQWLLSHPMLPIQSIDVIESPLQHRGLGSGTQMACTIAALLSAAEGSGSNRISFTLDELSKLSQRGKRSHIGLCGFIEGGFVIDYGVPTHSCSSANETVRTQRVPFPNWPVIIIQDKAGRGDSGQDEAAMFDRCSGCSNPNREAMVQLVQEEILPAIIAKDWPQFDLALGRYGRWAGEVFKPVQGGIYRTSHIAQCIEVANKLGLQGATQSSWGPTVCAIAKDDEHAVWCHARLQSALPRIAVSITKAANDPARVAQL